MALDLEPYRILGSHYVYRAANGRTISVTLGHADVAESSLRKACAQAGIDWAEFEERY